MSCVQKIFANTLLNAYNQLIALQIRFPGHTLLTEEGIMTLSSLAQKLQLKQGLKCLLHYDQASHFFDTTHKM